MKTGTKIALGFVAGAGVGATIATLYLRNFYTKFINDSLNEEIDKEMDKIKKEYNDKINELYSKTESEPEREAEAEKEPAKKKSTKKAVNKANNKETNTDYTKYSSDKKKKAQEPIIDNELIDEKTGSIIIEFAEYVDDNGYDKVTTTYFAGDGVYTDDFDNPDPDIPDVIGDLINKFEDYGEGNSLYVRSDDRQTDYEIIFESGTYQDYLTTL